jgi:hypothetical protein
MIQDFGAGSFLLWPLLKLGEDFDKSGSDPAQFWVFLVGAVLFVFGWAVRRLFSTQS